MKIAFAGDLCVSTPTEKIVVDLKIQSFFKESNYSFCCFEAPYIESELPEYIKEGVILKQAKDVEKLLPLFTHASLANNHSMDYGIQGCLETIEYLKNKNITAVGAGKNYPDMYAPVILNSDGVKVAVFCFGEAQYGCCKNELYEDGGYAWILNPNNYQLISKIKKEVDHVVLFAHAGLEDVDFPLLDWQVYYHSFIDAGVDLIIGGHPHVIQGKEIYKGKTIYYSLGNFFFNDIYGSLDSRGINSLILQCVFTKNEISINEVFISKENNDLLIANTEQEKRFKELSTLLVSERRDEYLKLHDEVLMKCWNDYYKLYYSFPIFKIKSKVPFYKRVFNNVMEKYVHRCFLPPVSLNKIYHNINIESHRFAVARVCSVLSKTY